MPLTVRLESGTEHCLHDLLVEIGQDKSSLIHQLIREGWQQRRRLLGQHLQKRRTEQSPHAPTRNRRPVSRSGAVD